MSEQTTLRDALESSFEEVETNLAVDTTETERPRDEQGRFAKLEKLDVPVQGPDGGAEPDKPAEVPQAAGENKAAAPDLTERPPRPSSWKKDYWDKWDTLDPALAKYIHEREQQYAKGVSTYKSEWEQAKPLIDAIAPFQPVLQQHGITPQQWIQNLGNAHHTLAMGSPQQKIQMFQQLARDYNIPLEYLTGQQQQQGFDPLQYVNPIYERVQQLEGRLTQYLTTQEQQQQAAIQNEITKFADQHPHFEAVRETMAGLLQSGVATDLNQAYDKAVRLHDDIFQTEIAAKAQAEAAKKAEEAAKLARQAKAKTISVKGNTPVTSDGKGNKELRSMLSEQIENAMGGRV